MFVSSIEDVYLFPFDDAKVRRILELAMNYHQFLNKNRLSFDVYQAYCVRTHLNCVRKQLLFDLICQCNEFRDRKLFRPTGHHRV